MKTLLIIITLLFVGLIGYNFIVEQGTEARPYVEIPRPPDIPDTLADGTTVIWDAPWHDSYQQGDVMVIWKDSSDHTKGASGVTRIVRDVKPWMKKEK
jgi:hypothetical protein